MIIKGKSYCQKVNFFLKKYENFEFGKNMVSMVTSSAVNNDM